MNRIEYITDSFNLTDGPRVDEKLEKHFNWRGADGWTLTFIMPMPNVSDHLLLIFSRAAIAD